MCRGVTFASFQAEENIPLVIHMLTNLLSDGEIAGEAIYNSLTYTVGTSRLTIRRILYHSFHLMNRFLRKSQTSIRIRFMFLNEIVHRTLFKLIGIIRSYILGQVGKIVIE